MIWIIIAFAILSMAYPLTFPAVYQRDWGYFDSLSLMTQSAMLHYRNHGGPFLPIHDPWCGGGLNVLANPQNRIFSPFMLFDIALHPYWANLWSLIVLAGLGLWGMYRLLRETQIPKPAALLTAILFINGTWFGLHFAEGHIVYGSMLLLPWALWAFLRIERRRARLLLGALMAFFLLDGGMYTFIFAILMLATAFIAGLKNRKNTLAALARDPLFTMGCLGSSVLLATPKLFPILYEIRHRTPQIEFFSMPVRSVVTALLSPAQRLIFATPGVWYNFQEFGCYLGIIPLILVLRRWIRDPKCLKTDGPLIALMVFWFWIGTGWLAPINPWHLFHKIPIVNNAHIQSRLFLLLFIFFLMAAARALSAFDSRKKGVIALFAFLIIESVFARNFPFDIHRKSHQQDIFKGYEASNRIDATVKNMGKPQVYLAHNHASVACYEPATPFQTKVLGQEEKNYPGEIKVLQGQGKAEVKYYVPGEITITSTGPEPKTVLLNTNDLGHWHPHRSDVKVISSKGDLLTMEVPGGDQEFIVSLKPWYLIPCLICYFTGIALFAFLYLTRRSGEGKNSNLRSSI